MAVAAVGGDSGGGSGGGGGGGSKGAGDGNGGTIGLAIDAAGRRPLKYRQSNQRMC